MKHVFVILSEEEAETDWFSNERLPGASFRSCVHQQGYDSHDNQRFQKSAKLLYTLPLIRKRFADMPLVLSAEIFPLRVRGVCIGISIAAQWFFNFIVSQSFPILKVGIGLPAVFGIYSAICAGKYGVLQCF